MTKIFQKLNLTVTPIVAYGLVFLLVMLSWLGVERIYQIKNNFSQDAENLRVRRAVVENIKSQDEWADRLAYSLSFKEDLDSTIWRARTSGVIAAELQQLLRKVTADNGINNANIRVDPEPSKVGDLNSLVFDFTGSVANPAGGIDILEQLARNNRQIILNDVNIINDTRDRRPTRVVLSGFIPIQLTGDEVQ